MKRFMAFSGLIYYPHGGIQDLIGDYDTIHEAENAIKSHTFDNPEGSEENFWSHIYDQEERIILNYKKGSVK